MYLFDQKSSKKYCEILIQFEIGLTVSILIYFVMKFNPLMTKPNFQQPLLFNFKELLIVFFCFLFFTYTELLHGSKNYPWQKEQQ